MGMAIPSLIPNNRATRIRFSRPWQSVVTGLLNYAMVAILAITLAQWTWVLFGPAPLTAPAPAVMPSQSLAATITASRWFNNDSPAPSPQENATQGIKLVGVLGSTKSRPGFAILQLSSGKQLVALLNQEAAPGVKVTAIGKNEVAISQNGVISQLKLAETAKPLEVVYSRGPVAPSYKKSGSHNDSTSPAVSIAAVRQAVSQHNASVNAHIQQTTESVMNDTSGHANTVTPSAAQEEPEKAQLINPVKAAQEQQASAAIEHPANANTESNQSSQAKPSEPEANSNEKVAPKNRLLELLGNFKSWISGDRDTPAQ